MDKKEPQKFYQLVAVFASFAGTFVDYDNYEEYVVGTYTTRGKIAAAAKRAREYYEKFDDSYYGFGTLHTLKQREIVIRQIDKDDFDNLSN